MSADPREIIQELLNERSGPDDDTDRQEMIRHVAYQLNQGSHVGRAACAVDAVLRELLELIEVRRNLGDVR